MEQIYKQTFLIDASRTDAFGRATPACLLYFAQEAAGAHCALLGADHTVLDKQNLFWAIIRNRMEITRLPVLGETITVETWPMPTTRSSYPRATAGYDKDGNLLFRSVSLWVLMDIKTRTMVLPGKSGVTVDGVLRGCETAAPGSISPKELENTVFRNVSSAELDRNRHMNNTYYLDWTCELLSGDFRREHPVREFTICYLNEAREGDNVQLNFLLSDGPCLQVEGRRNGANPQEKQERIFTAQLYF